MIREIIHISADDFYASLVRTRDATLRHRPVVVGYLSSRGVVVGASQEARESGVAPGLAIPRARRLCPRAAFVQVDWEFFQSVSREIFAHLGRYSPFVEPVGLEEGFVDYTGCEALFGKAQDVARHLQKELSRSFSLSVSLGVGTNKLVSKVASRAAKLAGLVCVSPGEERSFLEALPVEWLPGLDGILGKMLRLLGVKTIGTLAELPPPVVERVLGPVGKTLVEKARGVDNQPVLAGRGGKELEVGGAFAEDVVSMDIVEARLYALAEELGRELRRSGLGAKRVRLRLTYTDGYAAAHSAGLERVSALDRELFEGARVLLKRAYTRRVKVRAIHLGVVAAVPIGGEQEELFTQQRGRLENLYRACDLIRSKYGRGKVLWFGKTFSDPLTQRDSSSDRLPAMSTI